MMAFLDRLEQASASLIVAIFAAAGTGGMWVVRKVLTNDKSIALLRAEIARRDEWLKGDMDRREKQRGEDREAVKDISRKVDTLMRRGA
jgi:hypothetical protein